MSISNSNSSSSSSNNDNDNSSSKQKYAVYVCRDCGLEFHAGVTAAQLGFHYSKHAGRVVLPAEAFKYYVLMERNQ